MASIPGAFVDRNADGVLLMTTNIIQLQFQTGLLALELTSTTNNGISVLVLEDNLVGKYLTQEN